MKKGRRIVMTVTGVLLSGIGCGFIKAAMLGTDPFTAALTGLGGLVGTGYGNIYAIVNFLLFLAVWRLDQHYIGIATLVNMIGLGYVVQYTALGVGRVMARIAGVWIFPQFLSFALGLVILCVGSSLYFTADMGVSTYDAAALILRDKSRRSFKACRMGTDLACVAIALFTGASVGFGTVVTAFFMGPVVDFFNKSLAEPLLYGRIEKQRGIC